MVVLFGVRAATGGRENGLEAGRGEGSIESDRRRVAGLQQGYGSFSCVRVFRLHEDKRHGRFGPVGFNKRGEGAVVSAKEGVGDEGSFEVVEKAAEGGCPGFGGNRFAVVLADEDAERPNFILKMSDKAGVKIEEADEGV